MNSLELLVLTAGAMADAVAQVGATATAHGGAATGTFYDRINPNTLGGLIGGGIGVLGAALGCIGGFCAPRGVAKPLVMGLFGFAIVAGLVLLVFGIGAFVVDAPWRVGYAFLLPGGLATVLGLALAPVMLLRYRQAEMRRVEAEAFRAG